MIGSTRLRFFFSFLAEVALEAAAPGPASTGD